jgi:hypothetical protein
MATSTRTTGAELIARAAGLSDVELGAELDRLFARKASIEGSIVVLLGEVARRQSYRAEGATGAGPWVAERFGVSASGARALVALGERAWDLPELTGALCAGELSLDKVRAVSALATPESDRELAAEAKGRSLGELGELARRSGSGPRPGPTRPTVRFNAACHSVTAQLPPESFALTRACLEARARAVPAEGETPYDERLGEAFVEVIATSGAAGSGAESPYVVVAHVPLSALVGETGETGEAGILAGELERDGRISVEALREIACDATVVIGVDDDVGHTMYEGRARRDPNPAQRREIMRRDRHCRFPGCANVTFSHVHHVVPWKPGGRTDLDNMALLCVHHHHLVHSKGWEMTGDANDELCFVGPTGRVMTSRPSPLWTAAVAS